VAALSAPGRADASESHTQAIDTGNSLNAVSCVPESTDCVVSDSKGNALYSTDVTASADATWTPWSGPAGSEPSEAVACSATSVCTIAAGHAVDCFSSSFCAAVDSKGSVHIANTEAKIKEKAGWKSTDVDGTTALHGVAADTTGEVIAFASARASVEACGGGGGVHPLGGGGYELCGVVNPHGTTVEACQFEVGTEAHTYTHVFPCESASLSGKEEPVEVTAKLEGLAPATNYYYRLSVTNKNGTESAPEEQFRTESVPPSVISESVSSVTEGYATLQAQINPGGEATYYAEYGTSACEVNTCGTKTSGEGFLLGDTQEEGSLEVTNLKPRTTYYYWVVAANSAAPAGVHGEAKEFTTPRSWEEVRNEEDEQFFKQRVQEEAKAKAELEARTAAATKEHQEEEAAAAAKKRQEEQASASKASIRIVKVKVGSSGVTVTLEAPQAGTVTISGPGLKTTAKKVAAGTDQIKVMLTKTGKRDRKHHKKVKLTFELKAGGEMVSGSKTVEL
jgi:hypothetical protein